MNEFKVFIVGESSGNPDDWTAWGGRTLVVARSVEEALSFSDLSVAAEVRLDKPGVLMTTEGMAWPD